MLSESLASGYYGKVPSHGDFVGRGLPAGFVEPWDAWLQEAVLTSRQQLGEHWLDCYLTSPIYRFALSPGICGEHGWLGVLMPSVDRVGRYFPMTVALKNRWNNNPFVALQNESAWFDGAETLALSSLMDNFNIQRFNEEIAGLSAEYAFGECGAGPEEEMGDRSESRHAWQHTLETGQNVLDLLPCFLDMQMKEHYFSYSVWWTQGSERVAPSLLICQGLPPYDGMAAMFDGDWQKWGWNGHRYPSLPFGKRGNDRKHA